LSMNAVKSRAGPPFSRALAIVSLDGMLTRDKAQAHTALR
jgi:hypothetical protein